MTRDIPSTMGWNSTPPSDTPFEQVEYASRSEAPFVGGWPLKPR